MLKYVTCWEKCRDFNGEEFIQWLKGVWILPDIWDPFAELHMTSMCTAGHNIGECF